MADDFLQGVAQGRELVTAGAQIGNMRAMRQERMMQLRAEEAMNAIKERHLVAQTAVLNQQIDDEKSINDTVQRADIMRHQMMATMPPPLPTGNPEQDAADLALHQKQQDDAIDTWMIQTNPKAFKIVADGRLVQARSESLARNGGTTPHQLAIEGIQRERLDMEKGKEQRLVEGEKRQEGKEKRLAARFNISEGDKAQIATMRKEMDALNKQRMDLKPDTEENISKRNRLAIQVGGLTKRINSIANKGQVKVPKGKVLVRNKKTGEIGFVPEHQLDQALSPEEGYEQVDEESGESTPDDEGAE